MNTVALTLLLTPIFVGALSLAGRRWGPTVSGLLVALPIISGPVLVFVALEQRPSVAVVTGDERVDLRRVHVASPASRAPCPCPLCRRHRGDPHRPTRLAAHGARPSSHTDTPVGHPRAHGHRHGERVRAHGLRAHPRPSAHRSACALPNP